MLKNVPKIVSPELIKALCEMGHGDEIVIADGNFPAETFGKRVIRADGIGGAGLISTSDDYLKFLDGLISGKILSKYTLQMMTTNQLSEEQIGAAKNWWVFSGFGYGLGVKVHTDKSTSDNNAPLGVFGWSGAAGSMPIADIKNGLTIFYKQHMLYDHQGEFESRLLNVIYSSLGDEVRL